MHYHAVDIFIAFVEAHKYWGYFILFFSMIIEGELFLLTAGILSQLGAFSIVEVFFVAFSGVMFSDVLWYSGGRFLKEKYPKQKFINFVEHRVKKVLPSIEKNPFKLVFISKFLYGFNHSTILVLGFLKTNFRDFFKVQIQASFLWVIIFLSLGYVFGFTALRISRGVNKFVLALIIIFLLFLIVERAIDRLIEIKIRNGKK